MRVNCSLEELEKHNFMQADYNEAYYIRYIDDDINYFNNGGHPTEDMLYYRTLYVDKNTMKIFAYNDYLDCEIDLKDEYIQDLINDNLIIEVMV